MDMNIAMVDLGLGDLVTWEALEAGHPVVEIADSGQVVPGKVVGQAAEDKDFDLVVVCPIDEKRKKITSEHMDQTVCLNGLKVTLKSSK